MVLGLRNGRPKNLKTLVERNVVIFVFFNAGSELFDDFAGSLQVDGGRGPWLGHLHMRGIDVMRGGHIVLP
jgi:hypothetical protein